VVREEANVVAIGDVSGSAEPAVVRQFNDDGSQILEHLADSPLLARGLVNLIALDPIAERFGGRWQLKRDAVYEHVERVLMRVSGGSGYCTRVSETDFLVVHPDLGPFGAQALCLRAFHEIWKHFLGEVDRPDLTVHRVTALSKSEITATPIDPSEALAGEAREIKEAARQAPETQSILSPSRWTPFVATVGRRVHVSCNLEPVFNLKSRTRIGFRIRRRVVHLDTGVSLSADEVTKLSRGDMLRIDMATMSIGLGRLGSEEASGSELSLILPLSYVSLAHFPSRTLIAAAFEQARQAVVSGVICEIYDAEGVPHAMLAEVVSIVRPWSLLVAVHLRALPTTNMKDVGLQATSISSPSAMTGDAEFIGWLKAQIRACKRVARSVMVYRCVSERQMAIALTVGASHASLGSISAETPHPATRRLASPPVAAK
jgi:hypothetical protein